MRSVVGDEQVHRLNAVVGHEADAIFKHVSGLVEGRIYAEVSGLSFCGAIPYNHKR